MCLLNVGKREGPQIIQLFGRGVRLKGRGYSLKRSRFISPPHPQYIEILETLHVFGIKANYMEIFRRVIEKEDVPSYELRLETRKIEPFPEDLLILGLKKGWSFDQELFSLELDDDVDVRINLLPRATIIDGREDRSLVSTTTTQIRRTIRKEILDLLDWDDIFYKLLEYKNEREMFNTAITKDSLKKIMYGAKYRLLCSEELIEPSSFESLEHVKDVVVLILKKYLTTYYARTRNASEKRHMELRPLKKEDENLLNFYKIQINEDDNVLINNIENLIKSGKIYTSAGEVRLIGDLRTYIEKYPTTFKNAYFKSHLYQPLLIKQDTDRVITIPAGLNEGETKFVEDLKDYLETSHQATNEVYLLRNLTRSRGVGFYESHSFYPDFIMWIKKDEKQIIVFIDPKGLTYLGLEDPKLKLHEYIREQIQPELGTPNTKLDAFIVSVTPYRLVTKTYGQSIALENFEKDKHILFQYIDAGIPNISYVKRLFEIATLNA